MHKTLGVCVAVTVLVNSSVSAQTSPAPAERGIAHVERQDASNPSIRSVVAGGRLLPATLPPLATAPANRSRTRISQRSHASRSGALIGLAAGVAAATVFWATSNCRYGSDSSSAVVTLCVVPTAAMIGGGWYIGRALGK